MSARTSSSPTELAPHAPRPASRLPLHAELGEERLGGLDVLDHDENVVHSLKRHLVVSPGVVGCACRGASPGERRPASSSTTCHSALSSLLPLRLQPSPFNAASVSYFPVCAPVGSAGDPLTTSRDPAWARRATARPSSPAVARTRGSLPPRTAPTEAESFDSEALLGVLSQVKAGTSRLGCQSTGPVRGQDRRPPQRDHLREPGAGRPSSTGSPAVGKEGKLSQRVSFKVTTRSGATASIRQPLIDDLVRPSNEMQRVIGAVAGGDLSKKVSAEV